VTVFEAVVLGLTQGITEFLPISSTAHLRIVPAVAGWPDPGAAFTAVLQLGTVAAVIVFFLKELLSMARAALAPDRLSNPEARRLLYLVVGTFPIGVSGVLFRHSIEGPLRSLAVIATSLIVVGVVMGIVERTARQVRDIDSLGLRDALLVGAAQALALVPGVSRSGITLVAAMAIGLRRDAAARFSFLLSVPAVTAAGLFELPKVLRAPTAGEAAAISGNMLAVGVLVAAVSGYLSIAWLLRFLRTRATMPFVVYRVLLGSGILVWLAAG
jgi:undecaprenyl-diphosphatase